MLLSISAISNPFKYLSNCYEGEKKIFILKKDSIAHNTKIFTFPGPEVRLNYLCGTLPTQIDVIL